MLRRWYSSLSLRSKATSVSLAITTLSLAVVAAVGIHQIRSQIAAEQHRSAESVAQGVSRACELALTVGDSRELSRIADSFLRDENVLYIAIYGKPAVPLAKAVRDDIAWYSFVRNAVDHARVVVGERPVETFVQSSDTVGEIDTDPFAPSSGANAANRRALVIGRVVVGLSTGPSVDAQARQSRFTLLVTVASALVGSLILCLTLGPWMRRLQRLTDASQSISRGDFSGSISDHHNDEIGRLAESFDAMRTALRDRDCKLRDFTNTLQDQVRQRTQDLEDALNVAREANRAKSLFLANMSHELRTPLNGVIGMVDLLLAAEPNSQQRRYCDIAKTSARSLLELINDILDFSKIEAGKLDLDVTDFNLHKVIEGVAQMLGERAERKNLELLCSVSANVPTVVSGDPLRLRQVITNLISNAIKFTETGEVVLSVAVESETAVDAVIRVSVRDSGIGIPADRRSRLFQSFSQVDASTTRKFGGTGLGLAISQRLVELMGGAIGVESQEGVGSTFWFTARLKKCERPQPAVRDIMVDPRGMRVLAVDDNKTNREIIFAQLESWSLRAEVADSAAQAMRMLHEAVRQGEPYRFAILDMHMPQTDGMQLAREIKTDPLTRDVILISLSSIGDHIKPQQMSQLGFAACLTKPALPSNLYDAIVDSLAANEHSDRIAPIESHAKNVSSLTGIRVLLAEDNEINRLVASELLAQAGCICTMAVNGREALHLAMSARFDVILMDCQMPELDGFETTAKIRESEKASASPIHRPIIALTANAIKGDRELCLAAGMDGYVTKPIDPLELFAAIRSFLSAERLAQIPIATPAPAGASINQAAPVEPSPSQHPPVDLESLQRRCMGNRKLAAKALGMFQNVMDQDISILTDSVHRHDAKAVAAAAHKIKGAAANVSAHDLRNVAERLEHLAKSDELSQTQACLDEMEQEMNRYREFLATALDKLAVPGEPPPTKSGKDGPVAS